MTSRGIALLIALAAAFLGGALAGAAQSTREAIALDGNDWARMDPAAREAFLSGFVAGAAAEQATGGRTALTGKAAAAAAARLQRSGALHFPFGLNVYRSHLDDYYFYRNRRPETLLHVLVDVNALLRARP